MENPLGYHIKEVSTTDNVINYNECITTYPRTIICYNCLVTDNNAIDLFRGGERFIVSEITEKTINRFSNNKTLKCAYCHKGIK